MDQLSKCNCGDIIFFCTICNKSCIGKLDKEWENKNLKEIQDSSILQLFEKIDDNSGNIIFNYYKNSNNYEKIKIIQKVNKNIQKYLNANIFSKEGILKQYFTLIKTRIDRENKNNLIKELNKSYFF